MPSNVIAANITVTFFTDMLLVLQLLLLLVVVKEALVTAVIGEDSELERLYS
jgi:hypothetical protein